MLEATPLTEGWTPRRGRDTLPAVVPGCVHTDPPAAGVIPDPFPRARAALYCVEPAA